MILDVILTDEDERYSPPEQDVLKVSVVGGEVFLDIGSYKETTDTYTFQAKASVCVNAESLTDLLESFMFDNSRNSSRREKRSAAEKAFNTAPQGSGKPAAPKAKIQTSKNEEVDHLEGVVKILKGERDRWKAAHEAALGHEDELGTTIDILHRRVEQLEAALRQVAEGDVGAQFPWVAYERIRKIAADALLNLR